MDLGRGGFSVWFQLFGVLAAPELNPRTPRNGNHAENPILPTLSAGTPE
jgi:hypothetical protein